MSTSKRSKSKPVRVLTRDPARLALDTKTHLLAMAALGDEAACAALEAFEAQTKKPAARARLFARLVSHQVPSAVLWSEGLADASALGREGFDSWQCACLRAILNIDLDWDGSELINFSGDNEECDDTLFFTTLELLCHIRSIEPLGLGAHNLLHELCASSDFAQAVSMSMHGDLEAQFAELIFQMPLTKNAEETASALGTMWHTHAVLSNHGHFSSVAMPRATVALFRAHKGAGQRLDAYLFGTYGDAFEALTHSDSEPEGPAFSECLAQLRSEGWSLDPGSFLELAQHLDGILDRSAMKRARNLATIARDDPRVLGATLRDLPIAYHLNYVRARCSERDHAQAQAIDYLFTELCSLGMDPAGVWPCRDPAIASSSPSIRACVELAVLRELLPPHDSPTTQGGTRGRGTL